MTRGIAGPPRAERRPVRRVAHGVELVDEYAWLRDPAWPQVREPDILAHLEAENRWYEAWMEPRRPLVERLFAEMKARLDEAEESVPLRDGDFEYQWRFEEGAEYRRWYRRPAGGGEWTCILDEPALAKAGPCFRLGAFAVSPDGRYLAWSADSDGSERFTLRITDLARGTLLADAIPGTIGTPVWTADSRTLLYTPLNEAWRPHAVRLHRLGTPPGEDQTLYEDSDPGFFVHLGRTQSRKFLVISAGDHETSEVRVLPAADPWRTPLLLAPREAGHEYEVDHGGGRFFIRSNRGAPDFRICRAPESDPRRDNWSDLLAPSDGLYYRGMAAFQDFLAIEERRDGLDRIRIRMHASAEEHSIALPEEVCRVSLGANAEPRAERLRLDYESMVTPATVFDYDIAGRHLVTRKVQRLPGGYDRSLYVTGRLMAPARDGARVPVSIVRRRDMALPGPLHLYAYGAYGMGMPPSFSTTRLSLLDRGVAFAIAHVRGGDELGRAWYEAGKGARRVNSFHDFIDAAGHLVSSGLARAGGISISGGSAGGMLVGAVLNMRPDLWRAAIAHVPFVDVLNTMLDESLPLTPIEWPEWGNPRDDADAFRRILGYSPYENVRPQPYPALLVTCGLYDPRVTYWEAAKWVAKLRAMKTGNNPLLLKVNMEAGHAGRSGRYEALAETAEDHAFLIEMFGLAGREAD